MLTSRLHKNKLINNKKEINILINSHKKFILINLFLFLTIFYLLSKTNNLFNKSKFDFFNQILINSGFTIKNIEVLGANHLDKDDIIKIVRTYNNVNIFKVNIFFWRSKIPGKLHHILTRVLWVACLTSCVPSRTITPEISKCLNVHLLWFFHLSCLAHYFDVVGEKTRVPGARAFSRPCLVRCAVLALGPSRAPAQ